MPGLFSRLKSKDGSKSKKKGAAHDLTDSLPSKPQWDDAWTRKTVEPEEIHELMRCCTEELKARGTPYFCSAMFDIMGHWLTRVHPAALDLPFLLLPFRPTSDPSAVRTFIRHFFDQSQPVRGDALAQEIRMIEPMVRCQSTGAHGTVADLGRSSLESQNGAGVAFKAVLLDGTPTSCSRLENMVSWATVARPRCNAEV